MSSLGLLFPSADSPSSCYGSWVGGALTADAYVFLGHMQGGQQEGDRVPTRLVNPKDSADCCRTVRSRCCPAVLCVCFTLTVKKLKDAWLELMPDSESELSSEWRATQLWNQRLCWMRWKDSRNGIEATQEKCTKSGHSNLFALDLLHE